MRLLTLLLAALMATAVGLLPAIAETRVALVIGNGAYRNTTMLANPLNDARDVSAALKATGFDVVEALDADKAGLDAALRSFTDKLTGAEVALFFYAGHGLQVGAENYLVPVDAKLERERDLEFEAVRLNFVMRQMEIEREGKTSIIILDACRDNPLARNLARSMGTRSASIGRGLAAAATGLGTFIAYATQPGNVALDGTERNSPFTAALLKHMRATGRNLPATMIEVRKDVVRATDGRQVPWDHSALTGDFYFVPGAVASAPEPGTVTPAPAAASDDITALKDRLAKLEAEAKTRDAAPPAGAMMTADGIRLAELRARAANLDDLVKDLRKKLTDKSMEQARAGPDDRMKLQRDVSNIMLEWTRRGQDLKKVRDEIAVLEGKAGAPVADKNDGNDSQQFAAAIPPVAAKPDPNASASQFEASENVRLEGREIRSFKAPNPDACRNACAGEAGCIGYQHGRKIPVMGQCQLFSAVAARHEDQSWRSGVRRSVLDRASSPVQTKATRPAEPATRFDRGSPEWKRSRAFTFLADHRTDGTLLRTLHVASPRECLAACENEKRCGAFYLAESGTEAGTCRLVADPQAEIGDRGWTTGLKDSEPARIDLPPAARNKLGFNFHEATLIFGEVIKAVSADTADGCMTVCRNTANCVAASFSERISNIEPAENCSALGWVKGTTSLSRATAIVRSK